MTDMSTTELDRDVDLDGVRRPQVRLSDDGIAWTPWFDLVDIEQVPDYGYVQARVWKEDGWFTSEVFAALRTV